MQKRVKIFANSEDIVTSLGGVDPSHWPDSGVLDILAFRVLILMSYGPMAYCVDYGYCY